MPDDAPALDAALSQRLERVSAAYLEQRYSGPGNPMGTQWLRVGDVVAHKVPHCPDMPFMNGVHGLTDAALLDQVLSFYAATEQPCWIDVTPYTPPVVVRRLEECGFTAATEASVLVGFPRDDEHDPRVDVRPIARHELNLFLDTLNEGFEVDPASRAVIRHNQQFWIDVPNWRLYLARVDGRPAGAAVLALTDDVGYLAVASTAPEFRGRGVHTATVRRRVADAHAAGVELVSAEAYAASISDRNLQRCGLRVAHVKTVWTNLVR